MYRGNAMTTATLPSPKEIRDQFTYDPVTGVLQRIAGVKQTWRAQPSRISWCHYHGKWPTHDIDHINGKRWDNRIENLRDVPHDVNCRNTLHTASGGCYEKLDRPRNKPWCARVRIDGKRIIIGHYATKSEGDAAYRTVLTHLKEEGLA